jgi:murein DD-endopeptidase MepM/ murein hydrolase activator NlpD
MSSHGRRLGLPTNCYFVSISRGDSIRTARIGAAGLWTLVACALLSLAFGLAGAADLAIRVNKFPVADLISAQADATKAPAGGMDIDPHHADQPGVEDRVFDLAARQTRLERRSAILAALAARADKLLSRPATAEPSPRSAALGAIETLAPKESKSKAGGVVSAYAPDGADLSPKGASSPLGASQAQPAFAPSLAAAATNPDLDIKTRLDLLGHSLERLEDGEVRALAAIDRGAAFSSARNAAILTEAGLDPERLAAPKALANAGGPFIPVEVDPKAPVFELAAARIAREVGFAERLRTLMPFVPLRKPLVGEASVTSGFGYRADPFLGRLALHPGVDLLQAYGSEIRSTGAGRVVHAGPMGGYGTMVEIDHGAGLSTRYGHMSEVLVAEGDEITAGALLGRLGSSGRSTGPHLHYEVRVDGEPVDPERFLRAGERLPPAE